MFNLVTPIFIGTVVLDCESSMSQKVKNGLDFVKRVSQILNISEELAERKLFNIVIEGKEKQISGQFLRNKPNIITVKKEKETLGKSRDH